ncbi:hypothetical protein Q7P35_010744 [Cladosporium inversicolor]
MKCPLDRVRVRSTTPRPKSRAEITVIARLCLPSFISSPPPGSAHAPKQQSHLGRFVRDNVWDPMRLRGPAENDEEELQDRYITFQLADDEQLQNFEIAKSAIVHDDSHEQDLCDFLHGQLKWPKSYLSITGVSRDAGEGPTSVDTLEEFRQIIGDVEPVFQLYVAGDYRTHSIFKLEDLAAQLSCDSRDEAEHLFALIRRNHKCSGVFIHDLMDLFAPVRDRVDREWEEVEELMTLCEKRRQHGRPNSAWFPRLDRSLERPDPADARQNLPRSHRVEQSSHVACHHARTIPDPSPTSHFHSNT